MGAVTTALLCLCTVGISTTASRMAWSFARDRGTPFSSIVRRVAKRTKVPVVAVFVVCICGALLTLIYIGSYTAFNDVVSLTITGFYGSYFLPSSFLLYRRVKGHVKGRSSAPGVDLGIPVVEQTAIGAVLDKPKPPADETPVGKEASAGDDAAVLPGVVEIELAWGPFHVPGILGIINNSYACLYMIFVIFWSFWPAETPVSPETMNYSVVVTGSVVLFSLAWYFIHAKTVYKGPTLDGEIAELVRATRRHSVVVATE